LEWAAFLALTLGAGLEAVIAWETPPSYGVVEAQRDPEAKTMTVLRDSIHAVFGAEPPLPIHTSVQEGVQPACFCNPPKERRCWWSEVAGAGASPGFYSARSAPVSPNTRPARCS
jgi:hypothetical protein